MTSTVVGFIPESNIDLAASTFIFGVDIGAVDMPSSINVSKQFHGFLNSIFHH